MDINPQLMFLLEERKNTYILVSIFLEFIPTQQIGYSCIKLPYCRITRQIQVVYGYRRTGSL